jgi:cytoskeletal protein RodZ
MSDWSENDMDKLFQNGSEKYDFEYNPAAWQQMDELLNQQERRRRLLWWIWGGLGAVVLATVLLLFIFNENINSGIAEPSDKISNVSGNSPQTTNTPSSTDLLNNTNNHPSTTPLDTTQHTEENGLGETIQQEQALPTKPGTGEELDANFQQKSTVQLAVPKRGPAAKGTATTKPLQPIAESGDLVQQGEAAVSTATGKNLIAQSDKDENGTQSESVRKAAPLLISTDQLPLLPIPLFSYQNFPTLQLPIPDLEEGQEGKKNKVKYDAFLLGLAGSSEFNSVGQGDYSEGNWKFGGHLEYRFGQRFALRTGISYIDMWYDAGKGEYTPPKGFWVDGIAPVSTRGQCKMLEIPLLVSYHFKGHQHNGFFATAGLASYIIFEEHYWYDYYNPPPDPIFYWGTHTIERDWFSIGHLSAGYQKIFSNKWSAQIGPYMQLPLAGIGHGAVKIYSLGVQANVNFKMK